MPGLPAYLEGACEDQGRNSTRNHFAQYYCRKCMISLLKSNELPVCICGLIFILIEPSSSSVKKRKPHDIGTTKNNFKEYNETYAENIF